MTLELAKKVAGKAAADLIQSGMTVGLGTGSTAVCFIEALAMRLQQGLSIKAAVPSSKQTLDLARQLHLPLQDLNEVSGVDITVDGADEIDTQKRMIKGGGGAHVREKILASSSDEMVVIVDETKLVATVGHCKLPVEILYFGSVITRKKLEALGYSGHWRVAPNGELFITENHNLIFDIQFPSPPAHPEKEHDQLLRVPGVVDTGFFFHLAGRIVVGYRSGKFEIR